MRWKGFLFIGNTVLIVFLLSLVFTDQWLENRLEELGTAAVGAQVDIDDLDLDVLEDLEFNMVRGFSLTGKFVLTLS